MTGYQSKKAMAQDKLKDDDLTIAYQSGYYDGKKAAQEPMAMLFGSLPVYDTAPPQPEQEQKCWCTTCRPITMSDMRFVVCPDCGNKRCPKANDHCNACTGSNEVGQKGSSWEHVKPLAQPAQEPVAWYHDDFGTLELSRIQRVGWKPLYTAPPQRTWVGLTDEEIDELRGSPMKFENSAELTWVRIIEAKLKEKNT